MSRNEKQLLFSASEVGFGYLYCYTVPYNLQKVIGVLSLKKEQKYHQQTFCTS